MKYLGRLTTATLFMVFVSLTYAAPTKSKKAEMDGRHEIFRKFAPRLKRAAEDYLHKYANVEAQDLSTAELQQWESLLLNALPHVAPVVGNVLEKIWSTEVQESQRAKAQFLGTLLGSVLPMLGLSNDNKAAVNRKAAVIQELVQAQDHKTLSNDDLNSLESLYTNYKEQGLDLLPDSESLPQKAKSQFIGSLLSSLLGWRRHKSVRMEMKLIQKYWTIL